MMVRSLETVHRLRYFRFCNVLHIWTIRAIPTYRVYDIVCYLAVITIIIIIYTRSELASLAFSLYVCRCLNIIITVL